MFCKYCGNRLEDGDRFCGACGHPVEEKPMQETANEDSYKKQEEKVPRIKKKKPEPEYDNRMTEGMGYGYQMEQHQEDDDDDDEEETEYTVEIPDMPTFPSTSAVATGVVWADLGFVIKNAPDTLTVEDLSAVLGIALEVGTAPANESGFSFYGMDEGYFAGTYAYGDHSFYISGYGNSALAPDKTILFIQQIS